MTLRRTPCSLAQFVLAGLLSAGQASPQADLPRPDDCRASRHPRAMWNLPLPTLGGRQLWADVSPHDVVLLEPETAA